eukprot:contig_3513_g752
MWCEGPKQRRQQPKKEHQPQAPGAGGGIRPSGPACTPASAARTRGSRGAAWGGGGRIVSAPQRMDRSPSSVLQGAREQQKEGGGVLARGRRS